MAWKNRRFIFRQDRLEDIMRTLARWYGVEVVYLDESVKSMLFAGKLDRSEEITPILDVLRTTDKLSVDVKGKKIVIGLNKKQMMLRTSPALVFTSYKYKFN